MTTSVCMGTYNGEKYIEKQLYSILHQTKRPNEVIICDDSSSDKTAEIVEHFIQKNCLRETWHFYQNKENKGYPAIFYYLCSVCTKDVVFLADQDDIWEEKKLEQMCKVLEERQDAKLVCCKFGLIDENGEKIHTFMKPTRSTGTGRVKLISIEDVFYKCQWPGMVMAYRNQWYQKTICQCEKIPHDLLLAARASEEKGFFQIDEELAYHRRHENNVGGEEHRIMKLLNKFYKLKEIENYLNILEQFCNERVLQTEVGNKALVRKVQSMQGRYEALCSGQINKVIGNAWRYRKEVRLATLICDVLIVRRKY